MNTSIEQLTGESHGSLKSYVIGLILSLVLTLIAFGLVMSGSLSRTALLTIIAVCAIAQILVQLIFFMHMGSSSESWNRMAFVIAIFTVLVLVIGSIWVMHHLHVNMHPEMPAAINAIQQNTH